MRTAVRAIQAVCALGTLAGGLPARAQPWIGQNGVMNSASRIPSTLAGGAVARGGLFTIYGVRFGSLGHTYVTLSAAAKIIEARVLSASAGQIDALMPESAPLGEASLVVTVDGQASSRFSMEVVASNPGVFSRNGEGWGPGRIENISSEGVRSENSVSNPARPGQRISMFGTGFGDSRRITVLVGGRSVSVARSKTRPGEEAIEFQVPTGAREGCYVPVYVLASSVRASNVVTMSVRSGAGPCVPAAVPLLETNRIGVAVVSRTSTKPRNAKAGESADFVDDQAAVTFASKDDRPLLSPLLLLPPAGACTAYTSSFQSAHGLPNSISDTLISVLAGRGLDAGPQLTIKTAGRNRPIYRVNGVPGYYRGNLGQAGPRASRLAPPLFLDPGEFTLTGSAGEDIGSFEVRAPAPLSFEWTDRDSIQVIDRRRPLVLHWRGLSSNSLIAIVASNVDQLTTAIGTCLCVADGRAGAFAIPPAVLANIPASRDLPGISYEQLSLSSLDGGPAPPMRAKGLQNSAVVSLYTMGRFVRYR